MLHLLSDSKGILNCRESALFGIRQLQKILQVLVLPKQCFHKKFEQIGANPFVEAADTDAGACGTACSFCNPDKNSTKLRKIKRKGVQSILVSLYKTIGTGEAASLPSDLPKLIQQLPNLNKRVFCNARV